MSTPPGGQDDLESRKTRFVPRSDIVSGDAAKDTGANRPGPAASADAAPSAAAGTPAPGGTVIGRTRLVGLPRSDTAPPAAATQASDGAASAAKPGSASGGAKTEFIRSDSAPIEPVVGWVVVARGPGRGGYKPVYVGMNAIGRAPTQRICLDYGDDTISREEHAFITYDDELRRYWVHGGNGTNPVFLGTEALDAPKELKGNDVIRLGKTVLRFYPVCSADFAWTDEAGDA